MILTGALLLWREGRPIPLELAELPHPHSARFFLLQLGAFGALYALTAWLGTGGLGLTLAWGASALAAVVLAALSIVPPAAMPSLLRASAPILGLAALLGALAFAAGKLSTLAWDGLGDSTVAVAELFARPLVSGLVREGRSLDTPSFSLDIAPECSGFEGMGLSAVMIAAFLVIGRENLRFPRSLLLVPLVVLLAYLANALRIALLLAVGVHGSPALAIGGFHSKLGWIMFALVTLGVASTARRSRWFSASTPAEEWNPTATYLAPLMALLAVAFLTELFAIQIDPLYPLRIGAATVALFVVRRQIDWSIRAPWSALGLGVLALVAWMMLGGAPTPSATEAARASLSALGELGRGPRLVWLGLRALGSVLVVPLAEELAFRGFLLRRLVQAEFTEVAPARASLLALVASSLAFGLLHQNVLGGVAAGLCFALAQRRGGLGDAVVAHAVANLGVAGAVLGFGRWDLWL